MTRKSPEEITPPCINPSKKQIVASNVHDTDSATSSGSESPIETSLVKKK